MKVRILFATFFLKSILRIICKVDISELEKIPTEGPGIIIINHINFLEVPLIQVYTQPRKMHGLVKAETWKNPLLRFFLNTYEAIPVNRGGVNTEIFKQIKNRIGAGSFVCIAPEGTRSKTGILGKGKSGITTIAVMSGAPIFPVIHQGGENLWTNIKHLRRTKISLRVGKPFLIKAIESSGKSTREAVTKEIMYQLAELLPVEMRGEYSDPQGKKEEHLLFIPSLKT